MDTTLYKVVFEGQTHSDQHTEQVKQNFTDLFQAEPPQIERLFSGQPIIVRKNLRQQEARQYEEAITRAGAVCRILIQKPVYTATVLDTLQEIPPWETEQPDAPTTIDAFSSKGRLGRAHFITYTSLCVLLAAVLSSTAWVLTTGATPVIPKGAAIITTISACLLAILASIPLQIRRLHDLGHTGWLSLISLTPLTNIPFLCYIALRPGNRGATPYGNTTEPPSMVVNLLAIVLPLLFVIASVLTLMANFSDVQTWLQQAFGLLAPPPQ
ncbi:DUF805 domain-containing protein [Kistimonas asteriae]|uniref:DUF805 domain-containing protein n=1 Tax=Kistimonas asteriae TaxID=517724 RepID=UPI001BA7324E|nr:DUF805 domain-containing protein [Kistimonas asteriae]